MESYTVEEKYCKNKVFVHFTFQWHMKGIEKEGLKPSSVGNVGKCLYCVEPENHEAVERAIDNILEEDQINERRLADFLGYEDVLDIPDDVLTKDYIVAIYFTYTGTYTEMKGENLGKTIDGFIALPIQEPIRYEELRQNYVGEL